MNSGCFLVVTVIIGVVLLGSAAQTAVSVEQARKIGEENLKSLVEQSYHYSVDYDTVIVLPVHSKTLWKNDFYLLYFLKGGYFQVEMVVDRKTGAPTILAIGEMSQPYHLKTPGMFDYRYFNVDSMMQFGLIRQRLALDSVRLVYFGVIPKLGKRGVIWEAFSKDGIKYFSLSGPNLAFDELIRDLNIKQRINGNYTADSIRMMEVMAEIGRLEALPDSAKRQLKLYPKTFDSLTSVLYEERKALILKFPDLGQKFTLPVDSTKQE